jgi:two-component system, cell cycle sensor histidine kinase and response regulator CckA
MASTGSAAAPGLLIVEDEPNLSRILEEHFTSLGYQVVCADNGSEALRQVMVTDFDAVICDMVMPRMAGDMFYVAVQRIKPALCERFVFVTGHGESPGVREFLAGVSERVIAKPFNLDDLTEAVRLILRARIERRGDGRGHQDPMATAG